MVDQKCRIIRNRKTHEYNNTVLLAVRHLKRFNPNIGLNPIQLKVLELLIFFSLFKYLPAFTLTSVFQ